jgi:hypothetical protein
MLQEDERRYSGDLVLLVACGFQCKSETGSQIDGLLIMWLSRVGHDPDQEWMEARYFCSSWRLPVLYSRRRSGTEKYSYWLVPEG